MYERLTVRGEPFWTAVYEPFMSRDLTREDLRAVVRKGLEVTRGSYTALVRLFNMDPADYKRFLNFLHKHGCHVRFQQFRALDPLARPGSAAAFREFAGDSR